MNTERFTKILHGSPHCFSFKVDKFTVHSNMKLDFMESGIEQSDFVHRMRNRNYGVKLIFQPKDNLKYYAQLVTWNDVLINKKMVFKYGNAVIP